MATAAEVRAWGNASGRPTSRGKLSRDLINDWDADHPHDPYEPGEPRQPAHADDDDFEGMFPELPGDGDGLGDTGETPPRKPPARPRGKGKPATSRISDWFGGKSSGKSKAKRPPRVSAEDLLGSLWRAGARLAAPLPPLQRTLQLQSQVAGVLLEDVVRDTAADIVLQPFARLAASGKTLQALIGPPAFVTAIMAHQVQCQRNGTELNPVFMGIAGEGLRTSLMAWMDVAGPKMEAAMAREAEFEEKYGQSVDGMIAMIFAMPPGDEMPAAA